MPALALALWALYFAVALGLRVARHRRRTGASGLVGPRGHAGIAQPAGEGAELAALALGVAAPALALMDVSEPLDALDATGLHLLGIALFAAGLAAVVASQEAMRDAWRIGLDRSERTELVTSGPFTLVRNPIFTGLLCVQAGLALLVPSAVALAGLALQVVSVQVQARLVEEPHLLRVHGAAYADYARWAGRFVPGLGRLR